ncbi:hypothetical protein M514_12504 [Trichuris suis]|uniref:Uncharacterized protein n=1 Tax=Trichuris suis TaxID=68888 RepID=A0A085MW99_9BILA|nr:hypothetical protein M514_12504 [Trichuris suis]
MEYHDMFEISVVVRRQQISRKALTAPRMKMMSHYSFTYRYKVITQIRPQNCQHQNYVVRKEFDSSEVALIVIRNQERMCFTMFISVVSRGNCAKSSSRAPRLC